MTGTHDNRALWDGQYVVNECFAESVRDNGWMAIGRRVECEDYAWSYRVNAPDARGLCSALADALGVELHPAGTAAKLQELAKERDEAEVVRSDRRRLLAENAELRQDAAENAADVWSEPVIDMTWQQCADLCAAMGRMLETIQHEAYKYEWRLHDGREDHRAHGSAVNGEVAAHLAVRYCAQCEDRYNSATDRVRLTGLEPQQ